MQLTNLNPGKRHWASLLSGAIKKNLVKNNKIFQILESIFQNIIKPFKKDSVSDLDDLLLQLDEDDLRTLNRKVVERLKLLHRTRAAESVAKFNLGDRVSFKHQGRLIVGTITRLNQKTVSILTDDQHKWNVAPDFLSKIIE